jgi:hypothetical protein
MATRIEQAKIENIGLKKRSVKINEEIERIKKLF